LNWPSAVSPSIYFDPRLPMPRNRRVNQLHHGCETARGWLRWLAGVVLTVFALAIIVNVLHLGFRTLPNSSLLVTYRSTSSKGATESLQPAGALQSSWKQWRNEIQFYFFILLPALYTGILLFRKGGRYLD